MRTLINRMYAMRHYTSDDDRRLARILLTILLAFWGVCLILAGVYATSQPSISIDLLGASLVQLVPLWMLYNRRLSAASLWLVLSVIGLVTWFAATGQGIHDYTLVVFPAVILLAGLTGRRRMGMFSTLLILLACAFLVLGEMYGWVRVHYPPTDLNDLINVGLLILISGLAVHLLASNLEENLGRARRELSERLRAEEALARSQMQLKMVTEATRQSFILLDLDMKVLYFNRMADDNYLAMFGSHLREDHPISEVVNDHRLEIFTNLFRQASAGGTAAGEGKFTDTAGQVRIFSTIFTPAYGPDGSLSGVCVNGVDITERRQAENALRESEALYHAMFDNISAVKLLIDPQSGAIVRANQAAANFYGYTIEELERMNINQINLLTDDEIKARMQSSLTPNPSFFTFKHHLASGETRDVEVYTGPVEMEGRKLLNSIVHDVTERNQAQTALVEAHAGLEKRVVERTSELRTANEALEKALGARDQFLSAVTHELRTPLIGILSLSQTLEMQLQSSLTEKQLVALQTIEQSGRRLHELVNDVLDYSRLQAGSLTLQVAPFGLDRICRAALQGVRGTAQTKGQELAYSIDPEGLQFKGDERRIRQVLANLLGNAVKFTPKDGRVELEVRALPAEESVRLRVIDSGIGIQPENLARLFQPFTQLDARLSREYGGTGLGLALVKTLVEMHSGRVEVESVYGQGSTFTVILPLDGPAK